MRHFDRVDGEKLFPLAGHRFNEIAREFSGGAEENKLHGNLLSGMHCLNMW